MNVIRLGALDEARRYLAEIPEQASAAALVSIAESLHVLAQAAGACYSCQHRRDHHGEFGCDAIGCECEDSRVTS